MPRIVDGHILLVIAGMPIYMTLGAFSLLYYISKYESDTETTRVFIQGLSFPLRRIYGIKGIGFSLWGYKPHPILKSPTHPLWEQMAARVILLLVLLILPVVYLEALIKADPFWGFQGLNYFVDFLVSTYLLLRSWLFGHKLKYMQEPSPDKEAIDETSDVIR